MLILDTDTFPRNLASRIRSALKKAGHDVTLAKSLEMASHILERRSWSALKREIGPGLTFPDDDELGPATAPHRRTYHVGCLVRDGVPSQLADQIIADIRPMSARSFRMEEDEAATVGQAAPKWRDEEYDRRATFPERSTTLPAASCSVRPNSWMIRVSKRT